ncbi:MAG: hypothetical protein L3J71_09645 [Victivallaceae bacterium]|nr:hypothetical protein [Victivallaceae bacterium]
MIAIIKRYCGITVFLFAVFLFINSYGDQVTNDAKQWLSDQKNEDGSWGTGNRQLTDTAEAFYALWYQGELGIFLSPTLNWINALNSEENSLQISRRLYVLNHSSADKTLLYSKLSSFQNPDGGFGVAFKYQSSPLITVLALRALTESAQPNGTSIANAMNYLINTQKSDGSWQRQLHDSTDSTYSDIALTAMIIATVRQYQIDKNYTPTNLTAAMIKASTFLETVENTNTTWGGTDGEVFQTALAATALLRTTRPLSLNDTIAWLKTQQLPDSSFTNSVYKTAIVLNALRDWEYSPVPEPADVTITVDDITITPESPDSTSQIIINVGLAK